MSAESSPEKPGLPPGFPVGPVEEYPYPATHDLRSGPDLHHDLLALLPLVGVWRGRGKGGYPTIEDFDYAQEIRFSHDGRPFLLYESWSWLVDGDGRPIRPAAREIGWWRPTGDDTVEVELAHPTGIQELYLGRVEGPPLKVEMGTDAVLRSESAKDVTAGHRLYGVVDGALLYAYDMAAVGQAMTPHMSARLERVAG